MILKEVQRKTDFRVAMGKVANNARENCFKEILVGASSLRQFRVDNPEITFRNKVKKGVSKQRAEYFDHIKTLEEVLLNILSDNPEIGTDPNKVWNMDETSIDCEYGPKEKVASSSASNNSGSRISADGSGTGVHVTCVVAVSASGLRCPPFFIIQGKHPMSSWTDPVEGKARKHLETTVMERFTREDWFPDPGLNVMTERGSMTMETLPYFMRHLNTFVRKHVPEHEKFLLTLDGHSSRKGIHPLNRFPQQIIRQIERHLDMVFRPDPAASDGTNVCRVYSPEVNTHEKLRRLIANAVQEDFQDVSISRTSLQCMINS